MGACVEKDLCQLFSKLAPYRQLEPEQLTLISRTYKKADFRSGDSLVEQGQFIRHVGIIQTGTAKVTVADHYGDELICGHLKAGDPLVDIAVLTGNRAASSVVCLEASIWFLQSREDFIDTIEAHPLLKDFFYRNTVLGVWWEHEIVSKGRHGFSDNRYIDCRLPFLQKALQFIHRNYRKQITLEMVAKETAMSKFHFSRMFKMHMGLSFKQYLNRKRIEAAKSLIVNNGYNITEASFAVGFNDASYFSRVFRELEGGAPKRLLARTD
jgi:AraC-like DNA-binding protein